MEVDRGMSREMVKGKLRSEEEIMEMACRAGFNEVLAVSTGGYAKYFYWKGVLDALEWVLGLRGELGSGE